MAIEELEIGQAGPKPDVLQEVTEIGEEVVFWDFQSGRDSGIAKHQSCDAVSYYRFVNDRELYDIYANPFEKTNVIEQHPAAVARIAQLIMNGPRDTFSSSTTNS